MKRKKLISIFQILCILCLVLSGIDLSAQWKLIDRYCPDYPVGTICSDCDANDTCTTFILPPAKFNQVCRFDIPLLETDLLTSGIVSVFCSNDEITNNHKIDTIDENTFELSVWSWDPLSEDNFIQFTFHAEKIIGLEFESDDQVYTVNLLRDTAKVMLVLDISESMGSDIPGTTNSCIDELKDAINYLAPYLEQIRQESDSIGLTYFNSEVIQPNSSNFPGDFIEITDWSGPPEDFSSVIINNDLTPREPSGMAAMGEGLLDAKNKLLKDSSSNFRKIVFLFSDGMQNTGNQLNLDGVSFNNSSDSLNNTKPNYIDSIIYITVSTTIAADVPPIMAATAYENNGVSLHIDGSSPEYQLFIGTQLLDILHGEKPIKLATRIIGLNPLNDSLNIDTGQNLIIHINEDVNINTGSIYIKRTLDDSPFEEISVSSGLVTGDNSDTITINPANTFESETEYYILIDENAFSGVSGNNFAGISSNDYWSFTTKDVESPAVLISTMENSPTNSNPFEITVEFTEEINGFDVSEIIVTNGTADNLTTADSIIFNADISPSTDGLITISVNAGVVTDNAGNQNTESDTLEITFDSVRPSVILTADNDTTITPEFNTYVSFSERIIGFDASEIDVTNGNINSLSTSDSIDYIAVITAAAQGEVDININENQVRDSAGNMNTAADELTVTYHVPTDIEILEKAGISIYSNNGFVIVEFLKPNSLNFESGYIEIYSLNGSLIKTENIAKGLVFKTYLNDKQEIYLVKLSLDKSIYYAKIYN